MKSVKQMIREALERTGEDPDDLVCYWAPRNTDLSLDVHDYGEIESGGFDDLPDREADTGYGGENLARFYCFGPDYVYVKAVYDGSERVGIVPRNPEAVERDEHPWTGSLYEYQRGIASYGGG